MSGNNIQGKAETNSHRLGSLKIVSMNLAGCDPSAEAPASWNKIYVAEMVQQELMRFDPDVLTLQECPAREIWAEELFQGYQVLGVGTSHAGYVVLLVRESLAPHTSPLDSLPSSLPAAMAQIQDSSRRAIINVTSCHLAPFAGGASRRSKQMEALLELSGSVPLDGG